MSFHPKNNPSILAKLFRAYMKARTEAQEHPLVTAMEIEAVRIADTEFQEKSDRKSMIALLLSESIAQHEAGRCACDSATQSFCPAGNWWENDCPESVVLDGVPLENIAAAERRLLAVRRRPVSV